MNKAASWPEETRPPRRTAEFRFTTIRAFRNLVRAMLAALGVLIVTFTLIHFIPGDPVEILLGDAATEELVAEYRKILGLEGTLIQQFLDYLGAVVQGDLGTFAWGRLDLMLALIGVSAPLLIGTFLGSVLGTTRSTLVAWLWLMLIDAINAFPFVSLQEIQPAEAWGAGHLAGGESETGEALASLRVV